MVMSRTCIGKNQEDDLSAKIQLNNVLKDRTAAEVSNVQVPLTIISGHTLDIYGLFLKSSGMYVCAADVAQAKFPMTFVDLKSHGDLIKAVRTYKEMALEIHCINDENEQETSRKKSK